MFDKYIIVPGTFRNTVRDGATVGFELGVRMPYYRGLGLSMVEAVDLTVDGDEVVSTAIEFTVHGNSYALAELPDTFDDRWEMGEIAILTVDRPGGLTPGVHRISVKQRLRISYMPVPGGGQDTKELELELAG